MRAMASPSLAGAVLFAAILVSVGRVGSEATATALSSRSWAKMRGESAHGQLRGWGFRGGGRAEDEAGLPEAGWCTCQFQVNCGRTLKDNERVVVTGDRPELGDWQVGEVVPMDRGGSGDEHIWYKTVNLRSGDQVAYKYVIVSEGGKNPQWETMKADRTLWVAPDGSRIVCRDVFSKTEGRLITYAAGAEELWMSEKGQAGPQNGAANGRIEAWGGGIIGKVEGIQEGSPAALAGLMNGDDIVRMGSLTRREVREGGEILLSRAIEGAVGGSPLAVVAVRGPAWSSKGEEGATVLLSLQPRKWSGMGLIGCSLVLAEGLVQPPVQGGDSDKKKGSRSLGGRRLGSGLQGLKARRKQQEEMRNARKARFNKPSQPIFTAAGKLVRLTTFPLTEPTRLAFEYALTPILSPFGRVIHWAVSLPLYAMPPLINLVPATVRRVYRLVSYALGFAALPPALLLGAVSRAFPDLAPITSRLIWPIRYVFPTVAKPFHKIAHTVASPFSTMIPPLLSLPQATARRGAQAAKVVVSATSSAATHLLIKPFHHYFLYCPLHAFATLSLPLIKVSMKPSVLLPPFPRLPPPPNPVELFSRCLTIAALFATCPYTIFEPLISPPLTLALALFHAPPALLSELALYPPVILFRVLRKILRTPVTTLARIAAIPTKHLLSPPAPRSALASFLRSPLTIPLTITHRIIPALLPLPFRFLGFSLSIIGSWSEALCSPLRKIWHFLPIPYLLAPLHFLVSLPVNLLPFMARSTALIMDGVEKLSVCAAASPAAWFIGATHAAASWLSSTDKTIEWRRGGRHSSWEDAKEVIVVGSFCGWDSNNGVQLQPVVQRCRSGHGLGEKLNQKQGKLWRGRARMGAGKQQLAFIVDGVRQCSSQWPLAEVKDIGAVNEFEVESWHCASLNIVTLPLRIVSLPLGLAHAIASYPFQALASILSRQDTPRSTGGPLEL